MCIWLYQVFLMWKEIKLVVALNYEGGLKNEKRPASLYPPPFRDICYGTLAMKFPLHEMEHKTCQNWC